MAYFINKLPPSLREALGQSQMPEMDDDFRARLKRQFGLEIPEEEDCKYSQKSPIYENIEDADEQQADVYNAAEEYISEQVYGLMGFGDDEDFNELTKLMKQAVLYGAQWKEQQMMKKAVRTKACYTMSVPSIIISLPDGIKVGDKVKVITIKEK